ncbi:hypothetical protein C6N75_12705 [Streptomyces solincola]|uniref:Uncharacterized protein n=1 Tax=Streptomyces solincola TaxID=2100817 RepID=A0A2S9PWQ9_9ACTN|nr:hypothetical protein [Streptomyces solincola]PRH78860.1 hypothetical protein C6N75_12705 [Streptomyces solincola]
MTRTDMVDNRTVWIAPVGTSPDDAGAWTHVGYASDVTFEADEDLDVVLPEGWPVQHTTTFTVPLRVIRHLVPPASLQCEWTIRAIQEHAQRERITAALAEALASALLPCPAPFPDRAAQLHDQAVGVPAALLSPGR